MNRSSSVVRCTGTKQRITASWSSFPESRAAVEDLFSDLRCSLIIFCFQAGGGLLLSVVVRVLMGMIGAFLVGVVQEADGTGRSRSCAWCGYRDFPIVLRGDVSDDAVSTPTRASNECLSAGQPNLHGRMCPVRLSWQHSDALRALTYRSKTTLTNAARVISLMAHRR